MKITSDVIVNLKVKEVQQKVKTATKRALKDVVVDIAQDAIKGSPVETGNNRRSIMFEVGPGGEVSKKDTEAAVFSTSGYGGYLETGTVKMAARPYMKPALDRHIKKLPGEIRANLR